MTARLARRELPGAVGWGLPGLAALALYLATLSRNWTGDSLEFALAVDAGSLRESIEAHQLLVHPLAFAWFRAWQWLGYAGRPLEALQALNALGGAACVALTGLLAERLTGRARVALAVALGLAVSYGTWLLATDAEFVTVPLAVALAVLFLILAHDAGQSRRTSDAVALGLVAGLASASYQTNAALIAAGAIGYLALRRTARSLRLRQAIAFAVAATVTAAVCYGVALVALFGVRDWETLAAWQLRAGMGSDYGVLRATSLPHGAYAFFRTLAGYPGLSLTDSTAQYFAGSGIVERVALGAFYALVAAVVLAPLVLAFRRREALVGENYRALAVIGVWAALQAVFAVYWVPGDVSFWLPVLVAWWLVVALVAAATPNASPFVLALVAVLAVTNGVGNALPSRAGAPAAGYRAALDIRENTGEGDMVIVPAAGGLLQYVTYFSERKTIAMYARLPGVGQARDELSGALAGEVEKVLASGARVYAYGFAPANGRLWDGLAALPEAVGPATRFILRPGWSADVYELVPAGRQSSGSAAAGRGAAARTRVRLGVEA